MIMMIMILNNGDAVIRTRETSIGEVFMMLPLDAHHLHAPLLFSPLSTTLHGPKPWGESHVRTLTYPAAGQQE